MSDDRTEKLESVSKKLFKLYKEIKEIKGNKESRSLDQVLLKITEAKLWLGRKIDALAKK